MLVVLAKKLIERVQDHNLALISSSQLIKLHLLPRGRTDAPYVGRQRALIRCLSAHVFPTLHLSKNNLTHPSTTISREPETVDPGGRSLNLPTFECLAGESKLLLLVTPMSRYMIVST